MKTTFKSKVKNVFAKGKSMVLRTEMKIATALAAVASTCGFAFCEEQEKSIGDAATTVLKMFFGIITFAGIAMAGVGAIQFVLWALAAKEGQAQPGQMGKALGMFFGGLVCAFLKTLLTTILGFDPTVVNFA
jgi:hypothetical protein